jgi:hypothetical protein
MVLGSTQPLTKISTRNPPGGKGQPVHKVDNLTTNGEPTARKCASLDISPYGPPWPVTGISLPFFLPGTTLPFFTLCLI